jgi:hypothetical protein
MGEDDASARGILSHDATGLDEEGGGSGSGASQKLTPGEITIGVWHGARYIIDSGGRSQSGGGAMSAITTLEGLGTVEDPHPIQRAFIEEQAAQCGFCLSGVFLTAKALLDENPKASGEQIRETLSTVLCRCFVHGRMLRAIRRYAGERVR